MGTLAGFQVSSRRRLLERRRCQRPKATPLQSVSSDVPPVLVCGPEGKGLRPLVAKTCDFHLEVSPGFSGPGVSRCILEATIYL